MPQRILRDWTDSEKVNTISSNAECLFVRLMMKADDFGNFHANVKLVKSLCFPLKDYREADIARWMNELQESGMIAFYVADDKKYLTILNFGQRLRNMRNTFPKPNEDDISQQLAATRSECPPETNRSRNEEEGEEEGEENTQPPNFKKLTKEEFHSELKNYVEEFGKEVVTKFFNYWSEKDTKGKMKFQKQDTWETKLRLITWKNNEGKWSK